MKDKQLIENFFNVIKFRSREESEGVSLEERIATLPGLFCFLFLLSLVLWMFRASIWENVLRIYRFSYRIARRRFRRRARVNRHGALRNPNRTNRIYPRVNNGSHGASSGVQEQDVEGADGTEMVAPGPSFRGVIDGATSNVSATYATLKISEKVKGSGASGPVSTKGLSGKYVETNNANQNLETVVEIHQSPLDTSVPVYETLSFTPDQTRPKTVFPLTDTKTVKAKRQKGSKKKALHQSFDQVDIERELDCFRSNTDLMKCSTPKKIGKDKGRGKNEAKEENLQNIARDLRDLNFNPTHRYPTRLNCTSEKIPTTEL